jgi:hypothetical protein
MTPVLLEAVASDSFSSIGHTIPVSGVIEVTRYGRWM